MKKILHVSKYYSPFVGGVEQIARNCVLALKGHAEQKIICFDHESGRDDSTDLVDGVEVIRCRQDINIASQALSKSYNKCLKGVITEFDPDVIIFHYPNPFVSHFLLRRIKKNTKLVVWWHLDIVKQKLLKYFFYSQNRKLLDRADVVVATSPNYIKGSRWLSSVEEKCIVIPNCVDSDRLQVSEAEKKKAEEIREKYKGKTICLAVGRHVPYKGFEYLIKASSLLNDEFVFLISGRGPLTDKLKKMAEGDSKVVFLGQITDSELKANLLACDIYTFPSITKNEAFGVALAEGMFFGHPAVTFTIDGSGVNYVNLDKVTGLECPNKDFAEFANAIQKLSDDESLRKEYGAAAHSRVVDKFTKETFEKNLIDLWESLCEQ